MFLRRKSILTGHIRWLMRLTAARERDAIVDYPGTLFR